MIMFVTFSVAPWELFFYTCFLKVFCNPSPLQFDRFGLRAKKPHTSCDPQKTNGFSHIFYFRDAAKHAARHATEDNNGIENGTQNATPKHLFFNFSPLGLQPSQNFQNCPPGASPGGGGNGPKIDPKAAKSFPRWTLDAPKILVGTFQKQ